MSPESFVPATEGAGLDGLLDAMVVELACGEIASAGLDLDLHVNVWGTGSSWQPWSGR